MAGTKQPNPPQQQAQQPGRESLMYPQPESIRPDYQGSGKLEGKVAIITGGDSGIGRAVALHFAHEGAKVAIGFLDEEDEDARRTAELVEDIGGECLLLPGDIGQQHVGEALVNRAYHHFGALDILVNNAAEQHPVETPEELTEQQILRTFRTNLFGAMFMTLAALRYLGKGSCIINTASVTAARGHKQLLDYAATKGALESFTMSLAQSLAERGIRVNAVAPGPIWTPLIPASFDADKVAEFGSNTLLKRPGQPSEVAPAYVYLTSRDASYITGQTIHINGGGYLSI